MRLGISTDGESIDEMVVEKTPVSYEDGIELFIKTGKSLIEKHSVSNVQNKLLGIGGGIAGPFSQKSHSLVGSPNLKDWISKPFVSDIENAFGASVYVENDSALVGLGEAIRGAGKGSEIVAYITVSTGVGGARIVAGKIDEKSIGFEPGHQIIDADKTLVPDADGITLGNYISGKGVFKRTGKLPKEISDPDFWENMAKLLAYGLNNTIVHWSPDVVVLGGSMINGDPAIPIESTKKYLRDTLRIYAAFPKIKKSLLGDLGGLYGALEYIKQHKSE